MPGMAPSARTAQLARPEECGAAALPNDSIDGRQAVSQYIYLSIERPDIQSIERLDSIYLAYTDQTLNLYRLYLSIERLYRLYLSGPHLVAVGLALFLFSF